MRAQPPRLQVDADAPRRSPCQYEFCTEYLLCCSDPEPLTLQELLDVADADSRARYDSMVLGYTESQGMPELREAIAEQYTDVAAEDLLVIAPEEGVTKTVFWGTIVEGCGVGGPAMTDDEKELFREKLWFYLSGL